MCCFYLYGFWLVGHFMTLHWDERKWLGIFNSLFWCYTDWISNQLIKKIMSMLVSYSNNHWVQQISVVAWFRCCEPRVMFFCLLVFSVFSRCVFMLCVCCPMVTQKICIINVCVCVHMGMYEHVWTYFVHINICMNVFVK